MIVKHTAVDFVQQLVLEVVARVAKGPVKLCALTIVLIVVKELARELVKVRAQETAMAGVEIIVHKVVGVTVGDAATLAPVGVMLLARTIVLKTAPKVVEGIVGIVLPVLLVVADVVCNVKVIVQVLVRAIVMEDAIRDALAHVNRQVA